MKYLIYAGIPKRAAKGNAYRYASEILSPLYWLIGETARPHIVKKLHPETPVFNHFKYE